MKPATRFFLQARDHIIAAGYQWEIDNVNYLRLESITTEEFMLQYAFCALSSTGLNNQVVQKMYDKFIEAIERRDKNPFAVVPNRQIRDAIVRVFYDPENLLKKIKEIKTDEDRIAYIGTLRQMGPKSSLHLARNIGIDCVKPDRHMIRLAEKFGYATPLEMCLEIQREVKEKTGIEKRLGVIDVILWRYCNLVGCGE